MEGPWDLWAPLEKTLDLVDSFDSFLKHISTLFGRPIVSVNAFFEECYMYRRKGEWQDLLLLILRSIPNDVRIDIFRRSKNFNEIILSTIQNTTYSVKSIHNGKKAYRPIEKTIYVGDLPVVGSDYFKCLLTNGPAKNLPRPIFNRICAFLRVCKLRRANTDIRKLLVFILRNLEMDYILCFRAICGGNMEELKSNTQDILDYQIQRRAYLPAHRDSLVHRATHCAVSSGWPDVVVKYYIGKSAGCINLTALNWIAWRRREITYQKFITSTPETEQEFFASRPTFTLSLVKMFPKEVFYVHRFDWNPKIMNPTWYAQIKREYIKTNSNMYRDATVRTFEANAMLRNVINILV
jgi:hypothetical protein